MRSIASPADEGIPRHPPIRNRRNSQHADVWRGAEVARLAGTPPPQTELFPAHQYALQVQRKLQMVHEALRQGQIEVKQEERKEPSLYALGDWVWLTNKGRRQGENPKLQAKFVGPYQVMKAWGNNSYLVEQQSQSSILREARLKPYHACPERLGQAPSTLEPRRGPNMKRARPSRPDRKPEEANNSERGTTQCQ